MMYGLFLITVIVAYALVEQGTLTMAVLYTITTIVLFETLRDRWKNKLFKSGIEYKIVESLSYDIQAMPYKLDMWEITDSGISAKLNADLGMMREISRSSKNKDFRKVVEKYKCLASNVWNYRDFNERLYNLEDAVFRYIIKGI